MSHTLSLLHADRFEHITLKNADGTPLRARRTGKNILWKREPERFKIPCKYGLRDCFYIDQSNQNEWRAAE